MLPLGLTAVATHSNQGNAECDYSKRLERACSTSSSTSVTTLLQLHARTAECIEFGHTPSTRAARAAFVWSMQEKKKIFRLFRFFLHLHILFVSGTFSI